MAELKTKATDASVADFLNAVPDERQRADAQRLDAIMREETGEEPRLWGTSIVGYGQMHYKYASGREGDWMQVAFSPRKANLTLYFTSGFEGYDDLRGRLGKHTVGVGCVYIKRLSDVDEDVLRQMIRRSVAEVRAAQG